ncbi:MAG: hypothetical protein COU07_02285 [Candidatus Harrisonbacteria bacterium CG10_big_fil_rev_8_21_14_0_10_40_38]|uniref:HD domain-containing protein n=1 Tax=Candidatus Harrisonbacteria bacterium CG10_big_fil_rev_8_21_14_0_10_40_38 TaxID=1974583 RepID=A0A2H0UUF0_9BACT|nr:MAG: hypothetical protein COU07_02285 [Candidatus Harrisonbacteria bacterium CG10_big_fil_rev_8_21_14_0_10_40_38]
MKKIPSDISAVAKTLTESGFQAYLVGGCVRDMILGKEPKDWDIATNAKPDEVQKVFPDSVYENSFGTVGVKIRSGEDNNGDGDGETKIVEVTTFRLEGKYTDARHPDEIKFADTIEEDLGRRDFTVNAIALEIKNAKIKNQNESSKLKDGDFKLIDPYNGQHDLEAKLIKAVGDPQKRFSEDALRLLRAVRFSVELGFEIEKETADALRKNSHLLERIAKERIRDEFVKLIMSPDAAGGVTALYSFGLLKYILPELEDGIGVLQNKHHVFTVFEHNLRALKYSASKNYSLVVRLASLLHDVGKPKTKKGDGPDSTFYGHQVVGERMAVKALSRLHFSQDIIQSVALLVREHMFVYDPDAVTLAGVRRLVRRVGSENVDDLFRVREADRIGSGVPKAQPYRLRHLRAMVEKVQQDPIHPKMIALRGDELMKVLDIPPGPKVGKILLILLEDVLDDPLRNEKSFLERRAKELSKLSEKELDDLSLQAKKKAASVQDRIDVGIKKKYFVE